MVFSATNLTTLSIDQSLYIDIRLVFRVLLEIGKGGLEVFLKVFFANFIHILVDLFVLTRVVLF